MKLYTHIFAIALLAASCITIPMDPPRPQPIKNSNKQELTWITFIKKILLDQIPLQNESSGYALEDELMFLNDGDNSFKHLNNVTQDNIIDLLKGYRTISAQFSNDTTPLIDTISTLKRLSQQNEHLRKLFSDPIFLRQLIKILAKKFNTSDLFVTEVMKLGASHQILITQNLLLSLCIEGLSEKEFEKQLNSLIKNDNADVNFTYFNAETPLMAVVKTQTPSLVRVLIKAGADRFMKNKNGQTAKDILDEYWPNPLQTLEMPLEYRIALKALMGKKYR